MKQMDVTIMGQSYLLGCPDGGDVALKRAVAQVDREMCAIRDAGKIRARERIAVLAALNLAYLLAESSEKPAPAASGAASSDRETKPADIDNLLKRLDDALAEDGQLL